MKNKFEFHSKSSTLKKLKPLLKNSKILDIFSFNFGRMGRKSSIYY